jgi:hypothetical protein
LKLAVNLRRSRLLMGQEVRHRLFPVQFFPTTSDV